MRTTINAPAKVNLALEIVGKRSDGYHLVKMITQAVDVCDTVTITDDNDDDIPVRLSCDDESLENSDNIVFKAVDCFFKETEVTPVPLSIKLKKKIPVAAGLGGGSADAAAVIVGLNEMFDTALTVDEMCEIGGMVGSDVPACIVGGTALVEGTGTLINPLPDLDECYFVLGLADQKRSTGEMYAKIDFEDPDDEDSPASEAVEYICSGDFQRACKKFNNAFEPLWADSTVPKIKQTMEESGALYAGLTGSGPTVLGIFEDRGEANECAGELRKFCREVFVCEPCETGAYIG